MISSGGGLMSKRGLGGKMGGGDVVLPEVGERVALTSGVERSNAEVEEVIAYEPPLPGEEMCEVCGSGEDHRECERDAAPPPGDQLAVPTIPRGVEA